jgi:ABC-2 type transport system permease protein
MRNKETILSTLAASVRLFALTLRRQFLSRQTLVSLALAVLCCLIVVAWSRQREPTPKRFAEQVLVPIYVAFLMPVLAICYGSSSVGGEREDRTLIYLLITPIPRPLVYFVKSLAMLALVAVWACTTLYVLCRCAGESGRAPFDIFLLPCLFAASAYGSLFLLLGTLFRHGTMISLGYWFFLEVLFGNMPGIIKRVSIAFYTRCLIYDEGTELKLAPRGRAARELFLPVSTDTATMALLGAIAVLLIGGMLVFAEREFRDVS